MKILFLHGLNSAPGSVKPTYLAQHGHTVFNPKLPDDDFDEAVFIAEDEFDRYHPDVVVGSSAKTVKPNTVILHSRADEVVPFADSEELVRNSGLPSSVLIDVGTEHRLADEESLKRMMATVENTRLTREP
jgi:hypothetical protein